MGWINSRLARARRFSGVVTGLVIGGVTLATALAFWWSKFGPWGVGVVGGLIVVGLVVAVFMPQKTWDRLTSDPATSARSAALEAFQDWLAEADNVRYQLLDRRPPAAEMEAPIIGWWQKARVIVLEHAPEYRAEFDASVSAPKMLYVGPHGETLDEDQADWISRFDVVRERFLAIYRQVRSPPSG